MDEPLFWLLAALALVGFVAWRAHGRQQDAARRQAEAKRERVALELQSWQHSEAQRQAEIEAEEAAEREAAARAEIQREAAAIASAAAERGEAERVAAERAEAERIATELESARVAAEKAAAAAAAEQAAQAEAAARAEAERVAAETAEAARIAAEQEALRLESAKAEAAARAEAERLAAAAAAERAAAHAAEQEATRQRLAALAAAEPAVMAPAAQAKSAAMTLVMVADDSKVVRVKTGRLLAQHQYQVCYANDGLDALQQLQRSPPDVLITDVEMPGMDGFELTRHIRDNTATAHIPVIMITAADDRHRQQAEQVGVSVLLGKPYPEDALIAHIRQAMDAGEPLDAALAPGLATKPQGELQSVA